MANQAQAVQPTLSFPTVVWFLATGWLLAQILSSIKSPAKPWLENNRGFVAVGLCIVGLLVSEFWIQLRAFASAYWWLAVAAATLITLRQINEWVRAVAAAMRALRILDRFVTERGAQVAESADREQVYRAMLKLHGLGLERREVTVDIQPNGSAHLSFVLTLVAGSGAWSKIPHYLIDLNITDETQVVLETPWVDNHRIYVDQLKRTGTELISDIRFVPSLRVGEPIRLACSSRIGPGSFPVRAGDVRPPFTPEYYWRSSVPTKELHVRIIFPLDVEPRVWSFDVQTGQTPIRHEEEHARANRFVNDGRTGDRRLFIEARIPHPLIAATYLWKWEPVP